MSDTLAEGLLEPFAYGEGFVDYILGDAPAAGANFSLPFLDGRWDVRILSCIVTLDTDANAANRLLSLDYIVRGVTFVRNAASVVWTASTVAQVFMFKINQAVAEWNTNTPCFVPLLDLFLNPGMTAQITVDNKQVGDTLTSIRFVVEKFPTGRRGYARPTATRADATASR